MRRPVDQARRGSARRRRRGGRCRRPRAPGERRGRGCAPPSRGASRACSPSRSRRRRRSSSSRSRACRSRAAAPRRARAARPRPTMSVPSGSGGRGLSSPPSTRSPPMPAVRLMTTSSVRRADPLHDLAIVRRVTTAPAGLGVADVDVDDRRARARRLDRRVRDLRRRDRHMLAPGGGVAGPGDRTRDEDVPVHATSGARCEQAVHMARRSELRWRLRAPSRRLDRQRRGRSRVRHARRRFVI